MNESFKVGRQLILLKLCPLDCAQKHSLFVHRPANVHEHFFRY